MCFNYSGVIKYTFISFVFKLCNKINLNIIRMLNSLDPDQTQRFVEPDLGPNCLQRLSADDPTRQIIHYLFD